MTTESLFEYVRRSLAQHFVTEASLGFNWQPGLRKFYLRWRWHDVGHEVHGGLSGRGWHGGVHRWRLR